MKKCGWTEGIDGVWKTGCGCDHEFIDGNPEENEYKFCPYCGGELVEVSQ